MSIRFGLRHHGHDVETREALNDPGHHFPHDAEIWVEIPHKGQHEPFGCTNAQCPHVRHVLHEHWPGLPILILHIRHTSSQNMACWSRYSSE